jgi:uncharacterized membrane protein
LQLVSGSWKCIPRLIASNDSNKRQNFGSVFSFWIVFFLNITMFFLVTDVLMANHNKKGSFSCDKKSCLFLYLSVLYGFADSSAFFWSNLKKAGQRACWIMLFMNLLDS